MYLQNTHRESWNKRGIFYKDKEARGKMSAYFANSATVNGWSTLFRNMRALLQDQTVSHLKRQKTMLLSFLHSYSVRPVKNLQPCKVWGFHGGDYEECRLLGCYALWLLKTQRFGGTSALTRAIWCNILEDVILRFTVSFGRVGFIIGTISKVSNNIYTITSNTIYVSIFQAQALIYQ
jgi:hypothetical protein